ncbi:hypothetical protein J7643_17815 [bacterium]|nr:hypothetical protein [bacterium]
MASVPGGLGRSLLILAIALALGACESDLPAGVQKTQEPLSEGSGVSPTPTPAPPVSAGSRLGAFQLVPGVSLGTARSEHTSNVVGSYLYVLGGLTGEETSPNLVERVALDGVERSAIASDGTLGPFSTVEHSRLTTPRFGHCSVVVGSYLYVLGGLDGDLVSLNTVERAVINTNGVLGSFAPDPEAALALPRYGATCQVVGKYLYVMGGGGERQNATERALIREDGTLGPFELVPEAQAASGRVFSSIQLLGGFVYLLGGDEEEKTERASFMTGGTLGSFTPQASASLTVQRGSATSHVIGSALYVLGGWSGMVEKTLERAPLSAGQLLGSFSPVVETALTGASMRHTSQVLGRYLYVIGGSDGQLPLKRVERARIE